jgi:hypothetical protein
MRGEAMKLFINSGVWERLPQDYVTEGKSQLILSIPNYLEEKRRHKDNTFTFEIKGINRESFEGDLLLENISLRKTGENSYTINRSRKRINSERHMFALIRSTVIVPDDIVIPSIMKDKVKVIKRIRFWDFEPDYGEFLSNIYLIRINLKCDESIPIYLTCDNPSVLDRHYVIYKSSDSEGYCVTEKLRTYIYFNDKYISLSEVKK